ncbi:MAG TPA: class I SAM-dependent methyltransferase [Gaiellaceae bacterium]
MSAKFDEYKDSYREEVERSISFAGADLDVFTQAKATALLRLVRRRLGDPGTVRALDVGCGAGETDRHLVSELREIHGVDVSPEILETARAENPSVTYSAYDGERLPYEDGEFDLAFAICVVHHVPPPQWPSFARELARVVRPGGLVTVIEHNPLNPLTRLAVARCAFDDDAVLLGAPRAARLLAEAGVDDVHSEYIVFHPFRRPALRELEHHLRRLPLGAQYVTAGRRR